MEVTDGSFYHKDTENTEFQKINYPSSFLTGRLVRSTTSFHRTCIW